MNILFCEAFHDGTVGGSHACMYRLIRRMDSEQFRFTVQFAADNRYVARFEELGVSTRLLAPRHPLRGGFPPWRKLRNWWRLERTLVSQIEASIVASRADLVVVNNSLYAGLPYLRAARRRGVPMVAYERGIGRFGPAHARASSRLAAGITISAAVRRHLDVRGYRPPRVETIYDGVDPSEFESREDPARIRAELGLSPDALVMGMLGNLRPWKGQRYFVEAFLRLAPTRPGLHGWIIGDVAPEDEGYARGLRDLAGASPHGHRLHFLGYRNDAPRLLHALDVLVHASVRPEPFGMVLLEAMAGGTAVVAADDGGPREIVVPGTGLLAAPGDAEAIAAACARLLDDEAFRLGVGRSARTHVCSRFHIDATVAHTARLFTATARC